MKTEILRHTLKLFHTYGIKALSINDISDMAGIPRKILNRYFRNKETLVQECVRYKISQEEIFKYTDDSLLDLLINYSEAYPKLYQKLNRRSCLDIKKYYSPVYHFLTDYFLDYATICQHKVSEGIANGYIRKGVSPELVCRFFQEQFSRLFSANKMSEPQLTTELILTFARGISTIKGRTYMDNKLKKRTYYEAY